MAVEAPVLPGAAPGGRAARRNGWRALGTWEAVILVITVVVLVAAALAVDGFGSPVNASFLVLDVAPVLLIALPVTLIVMTGEIDLSVASALGLTSQGFKDRCELGR